MLYPDFAKFLIASGWEEPRQMFFTKPSNSSLEIFFASSHAIEVYKDGTMIGDHYITTIDELQKMLESLGD